MTHPQKGISKGDLVRWNDDTCRVRRRRRRWQAMAKMFQTSDYEVLLELRSGKQPRVESARMRVNR